MATPDVVIGMVVMFDIEACKLIDSEATHFFVSCEFVARVSVTLVPIDYCIKIHRRIFVAYLGV